MACDNANACCYNKGTNPKPRNFCRGILAPPGGFAGVSWAPLGGFARGSWPPRWLCRCFLALCVVQRPFARASWPSPVAFPGLPGLLPGLRFLPGYPGLAFLAGLCRCILALLPVHPGPRWLCRGVLALLSLLFLAFARRPKPGNTMVAILLINSFCGSKGNGPFLTKSWPKPFCQLKPGHMKLCFYTPGCPPRAYRCKTYGIAGPAEGRRPTQTGRGHSNLVAFPCFLCFSA